MAAYAGTEHPKDPLGNGAPRPAAPPLTLE